MEEFVTRIKDNLANNTETKKKDICKNSKYRELVSLLSKHCPESPEIISVNEVGDIVVHVDLNDIGLSMELFNKYKREIYSSFIANFLGELLIRENLEEFSKLITSIKTERYNNIVNKFDHQQFGLYVYRGKVILSFHISFLQSLLIESFKQEIK